jgi:hypothetical protein
MSTAAAYAKARSEIIALFGWGEGALAPEQVLRVDLATALRLALDDLQGRVIRGEPADMAKMLAASEALSRILPAAVLAAPPAEHREDPREALFNLIMQMRERDGIPDEGTTQATINAQAAKIERLKAQLAGKALEDPDVPTMVERATAADVAPAPAANVVPLPQPRAPAPAAPSYDYNANQDWKNYVNSDGSIRTSPRGGGKDWGPV